ncbi:MAG TPA: hypothetical protein VH619_09910 [Verrucomicrobiae bacterium]|jgi:hypothetical protein|nr:hypothetical protein [Verrucomicrobiae bacterium]
MNAFDFEMDSVVNESPASLLAMAALVAVTSTVAAELRAQAEAKSVPKFQDVKVFRLDVEDTEYQEL